jgi:hypothetical protein
LQAVSQINREEWPSVPLLKMETRFVIRSLRNPLNLATRLIWRSRAHSRWCPVDQALRDERRVPADLDAWFRSIQSLGPSHTLTRL